MKKEFILQTARPRDVVKIMKLLQRVGYPFKNEYHLLVEVSNFIFGGYCYTASIGGRIAGIMVCGRPDEDVLEINVTVVLAPYIEYGVADRLEEKARQDALKYNYMLVKHDAATGQRRYAATDTAGKSNGRGGDNAAAENVLR